MKPFLPIWTITIIDAYTAVLAIWHRQYSIINILVLLIATIIEQLKPFAQFHKKSVVFRRDVKGAKQALALALDTRRKTTILSED
jgi:hypothetical protein